jgi:acyl-CoA synthetase (AMP-forming)/AMP-acid ligase II
MNIAEQFLKTVAKNPHRVAVIDQRPKTFPSFFTGQSDRGERTFFELTQRMQTFLNVFQKWHFSRDEKVVVFVRPGLDFAPLLFSLYSFGLIPVFIDPGMGLDKMKKCLQKISPQILIGETSAVLWAKVQASKKTDGFLHLRAFITLKKLKKYADQEKRTLTPQDLVAWSERTVVQKDPKDLAAILFTSGGTGTPKGVCYSHQLFLTQVERLNALFSLGAGDKDLAGFPLFGLFTLCMGATTLVADLDITKLSQCDPRKLIHQLQTLAPTSLTGSPTIWTRLASFALEKKQTFPTVKTMNLFGAPIRWQTLVLLKQVFPEAKIFTPYGATEALPVCLISDQEILSETSIQTKQGLGVCVGQPVSGVEVLILDDTDIPISLPIGKIGEIAVRGSTVSLGYYRDEKAQKQARLETQEGEIHRMGDMGYRDEKGRIWFLGRKAHRVPLQSKTLYPLNIEPLLHEIQGVQKAALVSYQEAAAVVIECQSHKVFMDLLPAIQKKLSPYTSTLKGVLFHEKFPVDVRHHIKIDRLALGTWAQTKRVYPLKIGAEI